MLEAGGYKDFSPAEDYELSYKISLRHPVANLKTALIFFAARTYHILITSSLSVIV
ncbi:hypothetical protein QFZ51_004646 [Chitinophaga sp. W3I9]